MKRSNLMTVPLEDELGELLRAELLTWPGVTVRPMMGCIAFCHGKQMIGCYVNRDLLKKKPWWVNRSGESTLAWVRLRKTDAERALKRRDVHQCRTGAKHWIELPLKSHELLEQAIYWFAVTYSHPPQKSKEGQSRKRKYL
ncbi:MAG: hypothetical protein HY707_06885 [Ignavibacteriae bacterium]|nr:hypothetical protein [Ignavibacteriota bacterium]